MHELSQVVARRRQESRLRGTRVSHAFSCRSRVISSSFSKRSRTDSSNCAL
jgi:hypothetical protein